MDDNLSRPDDLIRQLEGLTIHTAEGSFVRTEDVRRLIEKQRMAEAISEAVVEPAPRTLEQARAMSRQHLREVLHLEGVVRPPGRAIEAGPHPSSRTLSEGRTNE